MKNVNNKSIVLTQITLAILAIFVVSFIAMPKSAEATVYATYAPYTPPSETNDVNTTPANNPEPTVSSISPNSVERGGVSQTVTITGSGFVPSSIARVNGANRPTTFIDSAHLLVQVNAPDFYRTDGGFFITVFNRAPGGGYSNGVFFTVPNVVNDTNADAGNLGYSQTSNVIDYNYPYGNPGATGTNANNPNQNYSSLASNAVFGSNSFLPSGIIQWILFAIVILLIVILARRIFGAKERYDAAPLKHD